MTSTTLTQLCKCSHAENDHNKYGGPCNDNECDCDSFDALAAESDFRNQAVKRCELYAERIESQKELSPQVENWNDFQKGRVWAAKELAGQIANARDRKWRFDRQTKQIVYLDHADDTPATTGVQADFKHGDKVLFQGETFNFDYYSSNYKFCVIRKEGGKPASVPAYNVSAAPPTTGVHTATPMRPDANKDCDKAETGTHEPNMETLKYEGHINGEAARFKTTCLHCGENARVDIWFDDFKWRDER